MKDICSGVDRVATVMEWEKDYITKPNQERDIMNNGGENAEGQDREMSELAEEQKINVVDQLAELVDLLAKDNEELSKIAAHSGLLNQSQLAMMEQITEMNQRLRSIAEQVDRIAEQKTAEPDKTGQAESEVQAESEKS